MKSVLLLTGFGLGMWAVLLGPGWLLWGDVALVQSGVALALTLPPAVATLIWAHAAWKNSPDLQLLAVLGGSGVRMAVALGLGAWLYFQYPQTFTVVFWGWLLAFYLSLLAVEITILVRAQNKTPGNESNASS